MTIMTNEKAEKFLLKIIEQTKSNKLKWHKFPIEKDAFACALTDNIDIGIFKSYLQLFNADVPTETFSFGANTRANVLLIRLWNLLDSTINVAPDNPIYEFIDEYLGENV